MQTIGIIAAILILIAYAIFLWAGRAAGGAVDSPGPSTSLDRSIGTRAGFWRRLLAMIIDYAIIALPFQLIVAVLFVATSGRIQQFNGFTYTVCQENNKISDGMVLAPPPPSGSNFARDCSAYFLGAQIGRSLQVGRVTREGASTTTVWRSYMLDRDGQRVDGIDVDWLIVAAFVVCMLALEAQTGASIGDRATRIRVIDASRPIGAGIGWRKIIVRYSLMFAGFVPLVLVLLVFFGPFGPDIDALANSTFFSWFLSAGVFAFGWVAYFIVAIIRRRDPLYDKIAGTAVVRV